MYKKEEITAFGCFNKTRFLSRPALICFLFINTLSRSLPSSITLSPILECEDSKLKWNVVSRSRQNIAWLCWQLGNYFGAQCTISHPPPIMLGDEYAPGNWSAASTRARDLTNFTWPCFHHCTPLPPPCCLRLGTHLVVKGKEACSDIRSRPSSRCGCYSFHFVCVCVNIS